MSRRVGDGLKKRCACGHRKWAKCSHAWHFSFHHGGREYRHSLDSVAYERGERPPRSRAEAEQVRDRLRSEIRGGVDSGTTAVAMPLTVGDVADAYLRGHVRTPMRTPRGRREMEILVALARRAQIPAAHGTTIRLEEKAIEAVTQADIEAVRAWRRQQLETGLSRAGVKGGEVGINRLLSRLRHLLAWSVRAGYLTGSPFRRGGEVVIKLETGAEAPRTRRLNPGEEEGLLAHATEPLRSLIRAALSTGCRLGELLKLQWSQVRVNDHGDAERLLLPASKTKTGTARQIPVGASLRAVLSLRRHGPDGRPFGGDAYVFGNEIGERTKTIQAAWDDAVLRAHGHVPVRKRSRLTTNSRDAVRAIDLHFHDLRREFASRLLESKADLHDVQMFLGHANVAQTSTYLRSTPLRLVEAIERLEAAEFAQNSHTTTKKAPATVPQAPSGNRVTH